MKSILFFYAILFCLSICTIAQTSNTGGWQWQYPKPQGNTLRDIYVFNKDTAVAVGDLGTVIKTTDGGISWDVQHHAGGSGVQLNSVSFIDAQNGWAAGGTYSSDNNVLLKTIDGGKTWTQIKTDATLPYNSVYFVDKDTGFVFGEDGIVLRTTDGGYNWDTRSIDSYIGFYMDVFFFTAAAFIDKNTGFLVGGGYYGNELYMTSDCGRTWEWNEQIIIPKIYTGLNDINFIDKYHGCIAGDDGVLLITTDGGNTWRRDTVGGYYNYSACFTDTLTGWACGGNSMNDANYGGFIYNTKDGGVNWTKTNRNFGQLFKVRFSDKSNGWIIGQAGFLYRTTDGGNNWAEQRERLYNFNSIYFVDENTGWAVGGSGIILHTTDGGDMWEEQNSNTNAGLASVYAIDQNNIWSVGGINGNAIVLHSTDGGNYWYSMIQNSTSMLWSIFFINPSMGWSVGTNGVILKTSDGGNTWFIEYKDSISSSAFYTIQFINNQIGWVTNGYTNQILKTTDGGSTWDTQETGIGIWLQSLFFINENTGWAVGENQGNNIFKTTDGGETWVAEYTPVHCDLSSVYFINPDTGWIGGSDYSGGKGKILKTTDCGENWIEQQYPSASPLNSIYFADSKVGYAVGSGIFKTTTGGSLSAINANKNNENTPKLIELEQNYPNPFNPSTTIRYRLTKASLVSLKVYDILGRIVDVLIDKWQPIGNYGINWNPQNLSSGVYFYQLRTGNLNVTKKMILIR